MDPLDPKNIKDIDDLLSHTSKIQREMEEVSRKFKDNYKGILSSFIGLNKQAADLAKYQNQEDAKQVYKNTTIAIEQTEKLIKARKNYLDLAVLSPTDFIGNIADAVSQIRILDSEISRLTVDYENLVRIKEASERSGGRAITDDEKRQLELHEKDIKLYKEQKKIEESIINSGGRKNSDLATKDLINGLNKLKNTQTESFKIFKNGEKDISKVTGVFKNLPTVLKKIGPEMTTIIESIESLSGGSEIAVEAMSGFAPELAAAAVAGGPFTVVIGVAVALIGTMVGLLYEAFERFNDLSESIKDISKATGALNKDILKWSDKINTIQLQYASLGVTIKDVGESTAAIFNEFGSTSDVLKPYIEQVTLLSKLGISTEDSSKVLSLFQSMTGEVGNINSGLIGATKKLAESAGPSVQFGKVMHDIASASEKTLTYTRGNVKQLILAAVEARKLGTDINSVADSASAILDFNQNINDQMDYMALTGQNINLSKMQEYAWSQNLAGVADEQAKLIKKQYDIASSQGPKALEALAKMSGITLDQMNKIHSKMVTDAAELDAVRKAARNGDKQALDALTKYQKMQDQIKNAPKDDLSKDFITNLDVQENQMLLDKISGQFNELGSQISNALLPVIEDLMPLIKSWVEVTIGNLIIIPKLIHYITEEITNFGQRFTDIFKQLDMGGKLTKDINTIQDQLSLLYSTFNELVKIIAEQFSKISNTISKS